MELIRQLAALALVFSLLAFALWLLRGKAALKWKRTRRPLADSPRLECLDRLALSPQHALHLVRAADRVLILVTHTGGCTLLTQVSASVGQAVSPVLPSLAHVPPTTTGPATLERVA